MGYFLSIVVPIVGGYEYVKSIVEFVLVKGNDEIELVIQDNSENNKEFIEYLKEISSVNIRYFHHPRQLTMTENFNKGISNSTGKYVCILGSDDMVTSSLIRVARYLDNHHIESAVFHKASYRWPGMKYRAHQNIPSLIIPNCTGNVTEVPIKDELRKQLRAGMTSLGKLPEPYHGIVKKSVLDKIYAKTDTYIPGACPDMAMAVALSQVIEKHIYIDAPITLSGQSYNSAGGKGARGEHKGRLCDMPFLPRNIEDTWPADIPKIWTGPTIYADSAHSALMAMGSKELLKLFNYSRSYAHLLSFHPEYRNLVKPYFKRNITLLFPVITYMIGIFLRRTKMYLKNYLMSNLHIAKESIYYKVETAFAASEIVDRYLAALFKEKGFLNE